MGCLPILLLLPAGFGIGYLIGGDIGGLWGAGIGLLAGLVLLALFARALRQRR